MATREELYAALRNADAAGDVEGARKLANYIQSAPGDAAPEPKGAPKPRAWTDVPLEALKNAPSSAGNFVKGIAQAVAHPVDTFNGVTDAVGGGLYNALPAPVARALDKADRFPEKTRKASQVGDAAGQFFKDRYGSEEGLKTTLATDPVGALSDAATVLSGGAAMAAKAPALASKLNTAARLTNPVSLTTAAVGKALPVLGKAAANVIGGLGTHTGAESIKQAYSAGKRGGATEKALTDNLRGNVPMTDVLDAARTNIEAMGRQKSDAYRQGMAQVSGDQTVLNFTGIDRAVAQAAGEVAFKGQAKNARAAAVQKAIAEEIDKWKALDPAEYHTPEGLDALKQRIGGIAESIPFEEKAAARVASNMYNAVKAEIVQQAPVYADTMKGYTEAAEQIREVERALSLGKKASVDTAMRKLQSLTRNNVNTNYGNRLDLARQLEQQGGRELIPALSGQALSSWTPRGLGNAVSGGIGLGGYALGGLATALPLMAVQSPRLMGEAALAAGQAARGGNLLSGLVGRAAGRVGMAPAEVPNYLFQAGRLDPDNNAALRDLLEQSAARNP